MISYQEMWYRVEEKYQKEFAPFINELKVNANMRELIFLGRGGQGMWTVGELLCSILIKLGKYAKVIFNMTGERRGTLGRSHIRYSDKPIVFPCCYIYNPDVVVISDNTLFDLRSLVTGYDVPALLKRMGKDSICLLNTSRSPKELGLDYRGRIATVDASSISIDVLGNANNVNTPMLGAYIGATKVIKFEELERAILDFRNPRGAQIFGGLVGDKNIRAARMGYENFKFWEEE